MQYHGVTLILPLTLHRKLILGGDIILGDVGVQYHGVTLILPLTLL